MNVVRTLVAGLVLVGAQPAVAVVSAQSSGARVVDAANGAIGGKAKGGKTSMKGAKRSTSAKAARSAPAIIAGDRQMPAPTAARGSVAVDAVQAPPPPVRRALPAKRKSWSTARARRS